LYYNITNPSGFISSYTETDPFYNRSWNQSHAGALFINYTASVCYLNGTNCPVSGGGNASWNQSHADTIYVNKTAPVCYTNGTGCPAGGSADGTGGWTNTSILTTTNLNVTTDGFFNQKKSNLIDTDTYLCDFFGPSTAVISMCMPGYYGGAIGAGSATTVSTLNMTTRGVLALRRGSAANTGYSFVSDTNGIIIGSNQSAFVGVDSLGILGISNGSILRIGLMDSVTTAIPTEGFWLSSYLNVTNSTSARIGCFAKNSTVTNTSYSTVSNYSISGTRSWIGGVKTNQNGTLGTCLIYDYNGSMLWNATLTIPFQGKERVGAGVLAYSVNNGTLNNNFVIIDFIYSRIENNVNRFNNLW
jgi:hypothetical protein